MLKLKMMLCVMMLPLVVVGCTSKQSVSQCVKPPPPPAWIMQPPPTGRHRWTGLFHPQREADHYAKTTGRNPEVYYEAVQIELPISMGNSCNIVKTGVYALPAEYKCLSNKTEQSIYECLLGFCFNNIFCAATNFGCIDQFSSAQTKQWWVMVSFGATTAGLFWTVNVCWAHPVISRASAVAVTFFSWCYSRCFLKFAESYV